MRERLRGLAGRLRRRRPRREPGPARVILEAIAYVENTVTQPRPHGWERVKSRLVFPAEHHARLAGIERFSHVVVVTYLDLAREAPHHPETLTLESGATAGILATRSQLRPNHLGISAVPLLGVEDGALLVRGLDAIDGTPVLDVKPYLPEHDAHPEATIPPAGGG